MKHGYSVQKVETPFYRQFPLYIAIPFCLFLKSTLLAIFFGKIAPMKYRIYTKINSSGKVISSCLEDYKTMLHDFFICNTFIYDTTLRFDPK